METVFSSMCDTSFPGAFHTVRLACSKPPFLPRPFQLKSLSQYEDNKMGYNRATIYRYLFFGWFILNSGFSQLNPIISKTEDFKKQIIPIYLKKLSP